MDTILAFMTREDAERYAKLLTSSLGTVPIVESVTKSELALTCRVGGHRCVVSNKGYELSPPKEKFHGDRLGTIKHVAIRSMEDGWRGRVVCCF